MVAGQGTGLGGWDWCNPGLWHKGDSGGHREQDVLHTPQHPGLNSAWGWGDGEGSQRGRYIPLSEDEEEMEREKSCSCRFIC